MGETTTLIQLSPDDLLEIVNRAVREALDAEPAQGFLDVAGAAAFLSLSEHALRMRVRRGGLPVHRLGSRLLFDPKELREFVTR